MIKKLLQKIINDTPSLQQRGIEPHQVSISSLGDEYNDLPLDGDRYVNGVCCRTVGAYKAALEATSGKDTYS